MQTSAEPFCPSKEVSIPWVPKYLIYLLIRLATPALIPLSAIIKPPPTTTISIVNIAPWLIDIES